MSKSSTGERLRGATQLWHAYLAATGVRFDLAQFLKDPGLEKQVVEGALASGDAKLIALAQAWLGDGGRVVPATAAQRAATQPAGAAPGRGEPPKPARYLRGVR
jgi:hypothetical protein